MSTDNSIFDHAIVPAHLVMVTLDIHEGWELYGPPVFVPEFKHDRHIYENILVQTLVLYNRNHDPKEWE
jgi:hypothetical protein